MPRLFAALEIPHDAVASLSLLRLGLPNARWADAGDYHLTLRFYGDVSFETADAVIAALDKVQANAFSLEIKGIHVFSAKKPHSLYAAITPCQSLALLQEKIENATRRVVPAESRKWTPHITLARIKNVPEQDLAVYLAGHGNFSAAPFTVNRFCLMSSKDSVGGGPYVTEETWSLA